MKILVKTVRDGIFEIEVQPEDKVADVKKSIESKKGANKYPFGRLMLIHNGEILKDGTMMEENGVAENSTIVALVTKAPQTSATSTATPVTTTPDPPAAAAAPVDSSTTSAANDASDVYGEAMTNQLNQLNPEGTIPELAELPSTSVSVPIGQAASNVPAQPQQAAQPASVPSTGPNTDLLNPLLERYLSAGSSSDHANFLDFLHNNPQAQALRAVMQAKPRFSRTIARQIQGRGEERDINKMTGQLEQSPTFTREEHEAIERLQAIGFRRRDVLLSFLACDRNEELAVDYLFDHHDIVD